VVPAINGLTIDLAKYIHLHSTRSLHWWQLCPHSARKQVSRRHGQIWKRQTDPAGGTHVKRLL